VRIVCVSDIHLAFGAIDRLADELRRADLALLAGDLTHFGDPPDAFRVVDAFRQYAPRVLAVTGNLDMAWVIDAFREAGISLHGEGHHFGELGIFGCGGSNITPMDTPTEWEEPDLAAILERGWGAVSQAVRRLLVCHVPPYDTRVDRLVNGTPVGSPAVRDFLARRQPELAIVGHIHEGRGSDRIGRTVVVNPGPLRDGGYVLVHDGADGLTADLCNFRTGARVPILTRELDTAAADVQP
jgi:uncharacterized protein